MKTALEEKTTSTIEPKQISRTHDRLLKLLLIIIALNLILLNAFLVWPKKAPGQGDLISPIEIFTVDQLPDYTEEIESLQTDVETMAATMAAQMNCPVEPEPNYTAIAPPPTKKLTHKLKEIQFPGARGTNATTWWDIPNMEVTFNMADYPNYTAYWEALLRVKDGAGESWARIYDTNAGIPIVGSEIKASSGVLVRVSSGSIKFWPENRTYRVQIKSLFGPEAVVEDAKIKISWIKEE